MQLKTLGSILVILVNYGACELCKPSGYQCVDSVSFKVCVNVNEKGLVVGEARNCPGGTICNDLNFFPCVNGTLLTTTTEAGPVTPPTCSNFGKYRAELCYQYYECVQSWFSWQTNLMSCPDGFGFDSTISDCVKAELIGCQLPTTITTTTTSTTRTPTSNTPETTTTVRPSEPQCNGPEKHPAPLKNQYYVCAYVWFQYRPYLETCPEGTEFNLELRDCKTILDVPESDDNADISTNSGTEEENWSMSTTLH